MPPNVAVMLVDPTATPLATPPEAIVPTAVFEEDHVAVDVTFCVVPSL
jgi:hypothetical protein